MAYTRRKKLYFDVNFDSATTRLVAVFACTQKPGSTIVPGDEYAAVLPRLVPCVAGSSLSTKRTAETSAWFVPIQSTGTSYNVRVYFAGWTSGNQMNHTLGRIPNSAAVTIAGLTRTSSMQCDGCSSIYTADFAVVAVKYGASTCRGRLYIQRQHSIEV